MHTVIGFATALAVLVATGALAAPPLRGRVGISVAPLTSVKSDASWNLGEGYQFGPTSSAATTQTARRLRSAGFEFVRMVVNPLPLVSNTDRSRAQALDDIKGATQTYLDAGLSVVVDFHFWSPDPKGALEGALSSREGQAAYGIALARLARQLQRFPRGRVALELLNEPPLCDGRSPVDWRQIQPQLYKGIRAIAPKLPVILTGCGGQVNGILELEEPEFLADPNVMYTFHFYEPFIYTHQLVYCPSCGRLEFPQPAGARPVTGEAGGAKRGELRSYLANGADQALLAKRFDQVDQWAARHRVPSDRILLGEFGAVIGPNPKNEAFRPSELRWLSTVRSLAEQHRFAYAFWTYPNDTFAFNYDRAEGFLRADIVSAVTPLAPLASAASR